MLQHPVPDEHLTQIGDIVVSFAYLEDKFRELICAILGRRDRVGDAIVSELSFRNTRALVRSIALETYGDGHVHVTAIDDFLRRATDLEAMRNNIAHSIWGADGTQRITRIKRTAKEKHGWRFHAQELTVEDLKKAATDIKILANAIVKRGMLIEGILTEADLTPDNLSDISSRSN